MGVPVPSGGCVSPRAPLIAGGTASLMSCDSCVGLDARMSSFSPSGSLWGMVSSSVSIVATLASASDIAVVRLGAAGPCILVYRQIGVR